MKTVKFSIDVLENYIEDDDYEFATVRLKALSWEGNSHGYDISEEVLKRDAHTILGKWIVAKYSNYLQDVRGHETDEVIVGQVPKDATITYETTEDGTFLTVDGVISKLYATDVYEMFKSHNERSVSVEMTLCFENPEDLTSPVTKINFTAITILGLSVKPSCKGANITVTKFSADEADKYYKQHQESTLVKFAKERKQKLGKGSDKMKVKKAEFAVNIGDLWCNVYDKLEKDYPDKDYGSIYRIEGVYEEDNQKFAIIRKKDETTLYKLNIDFEGDEIKFADEIIEIEKVYIEKETVVKFEEPEDVEKFTEFVSADENVDAQATAENLKTQAEINKEKAELSDDKGKDIIMEEDDDDEKEEETELAKCQAELAQTKAELEEYKGKLEEVEGKFKEQTEKFVELEKFKNAKMSEAKTFEVDKAMSEVKDYLKSAQFEDLRNEGLTCEFEQLDSFLTKVKAVAFEAMSKSKKPAKERQGMWTTAFADENINNQNQVYGNNRQLKGEIKLWQMQS